MAIDPPFRLSPFENIVNFSFGPVGLLAVGEDGPAGFPNLHADFSRDGKSWADSPLPGSVNQNILFDAAFGGGVWVVVGFTGGDATAVPYIATNSDPSAVGTGKAGWQVQDSSMFSSRMNAIAYGKATHADKPLFVAGDLAGNLATSADGKTWTVRTQMTFSTSALEFCNGLFLAATANESGFGNGTTQIYTSSDGITWAGPFEVFDDVIDIDRFGDVVSGFKSVNGFAFGNGLYVAVGVAVQGDQSARPSTLKKRAAVCTSTDGLSWSGTTLTSQFPGGGVGSAGDEFTAVTCGGIDPNKQIFVGVGRWTDSGGNMYEYATSSDGTNWAVGLPLLGLNWTAGQNAILNDAVWSANLKLFVAAGAFSTSPADGSQAWTVTSPDGAAWKVWANQFSGVNAQAWGLASAG